MPAGLITRTVVVGLSAMAVTASALAQDDASPDPDDGQLTREALLESMRGESDAADSAASARMEADSSVYLAEISQARRDVAAFRLERGRLDHAGILAALDQFDSWAILIDQRRTHVLDAAGEQEINSLVREIGRVQQSALPRLRRDFSTPPRYAGEEIVCNAEQRMLEYAASFHNVIICTAGHFRYQREMIRFHNRIRSIIHRLRFDSTRYRPDELDPLAFYEYPLEVPSDNAVVVWKTSGEYREIG